MQSEGGAKARGSVWLCKRQLETSYRKMLYASAEKYWKAAIRKVAVTTRRGRKASLSFPRLILGPLALLLLPTFAGQSVCVCVWMRVIGREALGEPGGLCVAEQTFIGGISDFS